MRAVNLVPVDQRGGSGPAAGRSEGGAYAVLILLAGVAGLALLYGTASHQISRRRAKAATLVAETQQAQAEAAQLAPYTSFLTMREQRVQAVSQLAQSRFDWAYAFHELGRVLPKDASISSLDGTVGSSGGSTSSSSSSSSSGATASATVTSATPPGSVPTFSLSGCATSQAEVAQTLNRLRLMNGVSSVTLQSSAKASAGSGGGGGGGSGGCASADPAFSVTIDFDPLPAVSTATAAPAASVTPTGAAG